MEADFVSQDIRLYGAAEIWNQPLQLGQRNLFQAIRDFLPKGIHSVLDVGCGDGKMTSQLLDSESFTLVGLDSSEEALSRLPFPGVLGCAQALPFPAGAFELLMSTDALEHMPDDEEAAAWDELFRVAAKAVMVAVPFREELLDASAHCSVCGHHYHVNWHQRSYDMADLWRRAPEGWTVRATVLTGEPWNAMLPPETLLRRIALNEWSGWDLAMCPNCGADGRASPELESLPTLLAASLAEQLYPELAKRRYCRSHSEILVVYQREEHSLEFNNPQLAEQRSQMATCVSFAQQPVAPNLQPFCQIAQHVMAADGSWRIQFPLYEVTPLLEVSRQPGTHEPLHLLLEDAVGCLFDGCALAEGIERQVHELPRQPVAGYYGVLASCSAQEPFGSICLGEGPVVQWLQAPTSVPATYLALKQGENPLFVQATQPLWFDPASLENVVTTVCPEPAEVLKGVQACFERMLPLLARHEAASSLAESQASEVDRLQVHVQNLISERDALLERAREADQLAVDKQNLVAERDGLLQKVSQAEVQLVQFQNLQVERDSLMERAREADQLAVDKQNLAAELDALHQTARLVETQAVRIQNLEADLETLLGRAAEADRLAVDKQNLVAERDALLQKAHLAETQAVHLQNLEAEFESLLARAAYADRLAVDNQNLTAERDAFMQKALAVDIQAVQLQNLMAERNALSESATLAERRVALLSSQQHEQEALIEQLHHRVLEIEEALREINEQYVLQERQKQLLEQELHACESKLERISQHFENRLGAAARRVLQVLAGNK